MVAEEKKVVLEEAEVGAGREETWPFEKGWASIPFCQSKIKCRVGKCLVLCLALAKQDPRTGS